MNPLVFHIVSGQSFFSGITLIVAASVAADRGGPRVRRLWVPAAATGLILVTISAVALDWWWYAIAAAATSCWFTSRRVAGWRKWASTVLVVAWLAIAAREMPYHFTPTLTPAASRSLCVVGDSVTAGIGGDETSRRWPALLAESHRVQVQDLSHMGETASSALAGIRDDRIDAPVILLEIGGNDLLGSTSVEKFEHDLEQLLRHLAASNRQLIMFELPLPPFCNQWGLVQRRLAERYHVHLIPRRVFLSVLADGGATLDSIHLSQAGHQQMARTVWSMVASAFPGG